MSFKLNRQKIVYGSNQKADTQRRYVTLKAFFTIMTSASDVKTEASQFMKKYNSTIDVMYCECDNES